MFLYAECAEKDITAKHNFDRDSSDKNLRYKLVERKVVEFTNKIYKMQNKFAII